MALCRPSPAWSLKSTNRVAEALFELAMNLIIHLLDQFRPVESEWCCERCRTASMLGAADKEAHGAARAVSIPAEAGGQTEPPTQPMPLAS